MNIHGFIILILMFLIGGISLLSRDPPGLIYYNHEHVCPTPCDVKPDKISSNPLALDLDE